MNRFILVSGLWLITGAVALNVATNLAENTKQDLNRLNQARTTQICEAAGLSATECNL